MSKAISKATYGPLTVNGDAAPGVVISFPDETRLEAVLASLPADVVTRLAVHGLSQKLGDSYANAAKQPNPLAWAKEAAKETLDQLLAGTWRVAAAAGEPRVTQLARAVARAFGISVEAAVETFTDKEEELSEEDYKTFVKTVKADAKVKKALADIRAEDAAKAAAALPVGESSLAGVFGA
jgi:hypothetical protein